MTPDRDPQICDYEGYAYQEFWEGGRDYEDAAERIALRRLLPSSGRRLAEIGAGYGRLVPLYSGYEEVVLVDHALSQLRLARSRYGARAPNGQPLYTYVAANFYNLPFWPGVFDTVTMVRALHHAADAPAVLSGAASILTQGGDFVLEFANKRNLKAILRHLIGKQSWSPFDHDPIQFLPLHFDFHPDWIRGHLAGDGLDVQAQRTVSHFRIGFLKRLVPARLLARLDGLLQPTGALWQLTPSVFMRSTATRAQPERNGASILRCVSCGDGELEEGATALVCRRCGARYSVTDGIYDLRSPISEEGA
jgi:SAM-dependent methyltransferase